MSIHRRTAVEGAVFACVALGLVGCAADSASPAPQTSSASASPSTSSPPCPNPEGLNCVGALTAGEEYTTVTFRPTLTYAVPEEGWMNLEDTPGNFLLVPPNQRLAGTGAGTADFIGVYTSIVAGQFTSDATCEVEAVPGVETTPDAIAQWMRAQPELDVSEPVATSVGGLVGQRVDVRTVDGAILPSCTDAESGQKVKVFVLVIGTGPSSLIHGAEPEMTVRLYLLDYGSSVLAVEVTDVDAAPATLDEMSSVVDDFAFSP
jgi:hypothetical protein